MKKILTSLALLGAFIPAINAQKQIDLKLDLVEPTEGQVYEAFGASDTFWVRVNITNLGPEAIAMDDSFRFEFNGSILGFAATDFVGITKTGVDVPVDSSIAINGYVLNGSTIGSLGTINIPNGTTITDFTAVTYGWSGTGFFNDPGTTTNATFDSLTDISPEGNNVAQRNSITINEASGINMFDNLNKESLEIFPNPATSTVNVNYSFNTTTPASIRVTDVTGRVVLNKDLGKQTPGAQQFSIDVSALNNGIYTIELVTDQQRAISKLTISK